MFLLYLDASTWSKRYTGERGCNVLDAILDEAAITGNGDLFSSAVSHAETLSALVRFRNRTPLPAAQFGYDLSRLSADRDKLSWLTVADDAFRRCTDLILKHNLNATDAALLEVLADLQHQVQPEGHELWLIAADKRFLRAAAAEGLACLDPEVSSPREVRELFARWINR